MTSPTQKHRHPHHKSTDSLTITQQTNQLKKSKKEANNRKPGNNLANPSKTNFWHFELLNKNKNKPNIQNTQFQWNNNQIMRSYTNDMFLLPSRKGASPFFNILYLFYFVFSRFISHSFSNFAIFISFNKSTLYCLTLDCFVHFFCCI